MKRKKTKIMSMILALLLIGGSLVNDMVPVKAADAGVTSETIEEKEISLEEYREILIRDGFTPEEADAKINSHVVTRGPLVKLYQVVKTKRKTIQGKYKLRCDVRVYVWRDEDYGNVEIDHATSPYIKLEGPAIGKSYSGNQEAFTTSTKVTVDYNGQFLITVDNSVSLSFGAITVSTDVSKTYSYWVDGSFIWNLNEI